MHHFLEVPFRRATITEDRDSLGAVHHYGLARKLRERGAGYALTARDRDRVERDIMCSLAGHAAEKRFAGRANNRGAHSDHQNAAELATHVNRGDVQATNAYLRWLSIRVDAFFEQSFKWLIVEAVAAALLDRQKLTRKEVRSIIAATAHGRTTTTTTRPATAPSA
jgi:hypothetical protein